MKIFLIKKTDETGRVGYYPGLKNSDGHNFVFVPLVMSKERAEKAAKSMLEEYVSGRGYLQKIGKVDRKGRHVEDLL